MPRVLVRWTLLRPIILKLKIGRMIGLHPCYVKEDWKDQLDQLEAHYLANPQQYLP